MFVDANEKSWLIIAVEIIFSLLLFIFVSYLTFRAVIVVSDEDDGGTVVATMLYWFGLIDIALFTGLYFMYKRVMIINVTVLITAIVISAVNQTEFASDRIDAVGAFACVVLIIVNTLMILIPSVISVIQPAKKYANDF